MSTAPHESNPANPGAASRFRSNLLLAMMLLVAAVTGLALLIAEHNAQAGYRDALEQKFQSQIAFDLGLEEARQTAVTERCRLLARSVRIRAALEEDDLQDLYENATIDLRDVLEPDASGKARFLQANFVRFVNSAGVVLSPNGTEPGANLEPWEKQLSALASSQDEQMEGYISVPGPGGEPVLNQVIATPVISGDTGRKLGTLVLGFGPAHFSRQAGGEIESGILLGNDLYLPGAAADARKQLAAAIRPGIQSTQAQGASSGRFQMEIGGVPNLVFYKLLDPSSPLDKAYQVSLHPLTEEIAQRWRLRAEILGSGLLILLGGLAASHFASSRLARPVEELAADSAAHQAGREQAEAAREMTEQELKISNTELQKALADLQAAQQQVIQQERLRALGEMASGIAHDFNNALMPIAGFSELLLSKPEILDDRPTALQYLEVINTGARDAGSVVGRLREFYRPNEKTDLFGAVMLSRVAKQALSLTRPKWKDQAQANGANIAVRTQLDDRLPVTADECAMRELLTNLIFNAVDAMPRGGTLKLHTRCEPDCGVMEVSDTGIGMTEEVRKRCLEPFYSTKGERGTGLGLSMVFGIVKRHSGSIEIDSAVGRGTKFTIRLPLHEQALGVGDPTQQAAAGKALQILLVDDEPLVRDVICAFLKADGHACKTAGHALEGIHTFRESHFDLVIADKAMPGMSGDQMAATIKDISPGTPFVLLTGFGSFLDCDSMPGVDVVAAKPITQPGLREAIGKALDAA